MKKLLKAALRGHIVTSLVLYGILALLLMTTNPYEIAPIFLFVPFVLFFLATFLLFYRSFRFAAQKLQLQLPVSAAFRISFIVSGLPTFLLLLQSIGRVGAYDMLVTLVLFAALDFYLARLRFASR